MSKANGPKLAGRDLGAITPPVNQPSRKARQAEKVKQRKIRKLLKRAIKRQKKEGTK